MNKTIWTIVIIVIIAAGYWLWNSKWGSQPGPESALPEVPEVSQEDTTTAIQQDLEQIDLGDIEEQFQGIDSELNNL